MSVGAGSLTLCHHLFLHVFARCTLRVLALGLLKARQSIQYTSPSISFYALLLQSTVFLGAVPVLSRQTDSEGRRYKTWDGSVDS